VTISPAAFAPCRPKLAPGGRHGGAHVRFDVIAHLAKLTFDARLLGREPENERAHEKYGELRGDLAELLRTAGTRWRGGGS